MEKPKNHCRKWERWEDDKLARMVQDDTELAVICRALERTPAAVRERINVIRATGRLPRPPRKNPNA